MELVPWKKGKNIHPFAEIEKLHEEMDQLFGDWSPFFSLSSRGNNGWALAESVLQPDLDISETKDEILVKADLPGLNRNDIEVSIVDQTLVIRGERKHESEVKAKDFVRTERSFGAFRRAIPLSTEVDQSKTKATYKDGVLELVLPKKEGDNSKTHRIDIN
jgi:HSP20 family protein